MQSSFELWCRQNILNVQGAILMCRRAFAVCFSLGTVGTLRTFPLTGFLHDSTTLCWGSLCAFYPLRPSCRGDRGGILGRHLVCPHLRNWVRLVRVRRLKVGTYRRGYQQFLPAPSVPLAR